MKMESKENKNNESKLTKHDITMLGIRSSLLQASFSYERMQAGGWTWAQIPVWKKIFGNDKKSFCNETVPIFTFKDKDTYELIKAPITVSPIIVATRAIISELS